MAGLGVRREVFEPGHWNSFRDALAIGEMSHRLVLVAAAIGGDNEPLLAAKIGDQEAEPLVEDPHLLAGRLVRLLGLA